MFPILLSNRDLAVSAIREEGLQQGRKCGANECTHIVIGFAAAVESCCVDVFRQKTLDWRGSGSGGIP